DNNTTPLQRKMAEISKLLSIICLGICILMFVVGILYSRPILEIFMMAVSLGVAAIPEGLAAIVTIVLALGVQRLVKRHAIVKKLPAVETLGAASVICSDKTGTLTQNKMTVVETFVHGNETQEQLL
ncbi:ATPase, partial [Salmonella enterica subsp. enterica serovar Heidelberg]